MITVKSAHHLRGYSGEDQLLEDTELEPVIGLQFRSVAEARKAAQKLSSGTGWESVPIGLEVLFADGTTHQF